MIVVFVVALTGGVLGGLALWPRYGDRVVRRVERALSVDDHADDGQDTAHSPGARNDDGTFADPDDNVERVERPVEVFAEPAPAPAADAAGVVFREDFTDPDSLERLQYDISHRDDFVVSMTEWPGDHVPTGEDDECSGPDESRLVTRGENDVFNDEWIYRCVPGGDLSKAHIMTSIGDTSGYSIGSFTPAMTFEHVREVRWSINVTDLGGRQFTEVKVIPADVFDFQNLPCVPDLPCDTDHHDELGAVGASTFGQELSIGTPEWPHGFRQDRYTGVLCHLETDGFCFADDFRDGVDPAIGEVRTRREHYFRDNGDGTLTFGAAMPDGTFHTLTGPGSFPEGPVRVVFSDHSYTPNKDLGPLGERYTWHWDDLEIEVFEP